MTFTIYNFVSRLPFRVFRIFSDSAMRQPLSTTVTSAAAGATVDAQDVLRFSKLSSEWWNEFGPMMALHSMNSLRVPWIRDTLRLDTSDPITPLRGRRILDVGCGAGLLSEPLARLGAEVVGIDASTEVVEVATLHATNDPILKGRLTYLPLSIEELPTEMRGTFDAVVASEILEHVSSREAFVSAVLQAIKTEGHMFFTTLNRTWVARLLGIWAAENVLRIVPQGIHEFEKFTPPTDLQRLLEHGGCQVTKIHGMWYIPIWNKWIWCPDTSINYAMHAVKTT